MCCWDGTSIDTWKFRNALVPPRVEYNTPVARELMRLMKIPVDSYSNLLTVLQLEHYPSLMDYFDYHGRKALSVYLVNNALENETYISTHDQVGLYYFPP